MAYSAIVTKVVSSIESVVIAPENRVIELHCIFIMILQPVYMLNLVQVLH